MNKNNETVDVMIQRLDEICNNKYLKSKKIIEPYTEIIKEVKTYKNANNKKDLIYAIEEKIDAKETFLNLDENTWKTLFVIVGLFITIMSNLIMKNYEYIFVSKYVSRLTIIGLTLVFVCIEISLYLWSYKIYTTKKTKEKCFYKLVYNILSREGAIEYKNESRKKA